MPARVIYVEDEASVRLATTQTLKLAGLSVMAVSTCEEAADLIGSDFAGAVLTDVRLPGRSGLDLLAQVMEIDREIPVVLVTGHGDVEMAVNAMRAGAYDFIEKPYGSEHLAGVVRRAIDRRSLVLENRTLREAIQTREGLPELAGESSALARLRQFIATIGPSGANVLINGETGTGKEVVARHLAAAGGEGRFVAINCAALPESMFESEMFGHEAGSFTGAMKRRIGKFEYARGGTVFLDEIESMPLAMQAKLLRVLQERSLERVGGNETIPVDCRVIGASKVDLLAEADAGRFRADLYYRVATVTVDLPPLRERAGDIPLLFGRFVQEACLRYDRPVPHWSPAQMQQWQARPWRGNVRELKGFAERLVLGVVEAPQGGPDTQPLSLPMQVEQVERRLIRDALVLAEGRVAQAAEQLGIPKKTLYDKLKRYDIAFERGE